MEVVRNKSDLGIYREGRVLKFVDSFANRSYKEWERKGEGTDGDGDSMESAFMSGDKMW